MRVIVIGATGNVGTSVLESLRDEPHVEQIVGVARRLPERSFDKTEFVAADIVTADLEAIFRGADAVIDLAWLIQPGRDESVTWRVNVDGTQRVMRAVVEAGVRVLLYSSSVGAYSPGPKDRLVDESWPTDGIRTSFYSRHKAEVERRLDSLELERPDLRVVRMRPGLIFKAQAATEIRRLFLGPLVPRQLLRPGLIPLSPDVDGLRFQAVHSLDVGDAFRRALTKDVRGAFNLAAEPAIGPQELAQVLHARRVRIPRRALRALAAAAFHARLQPSEPGWLDLGLEVPLMDTTRARQLLGWEPRHSSTQALNELIEGIRRAAGDDTPPLAPSTSGPLRVREWLSGLGARP